MRVSKAMMGQGVVVVILALVGVADAQTADIRDEYSELRWQTSAPDLVFEEALRLMGVPKGIAYERACMAWREWRGLDPAIEQEPDDVAQHERWQRQWAESDPIDLLEFLFASMPDLLDGDPRALAESAWLRIHRLLPPHAIPTSAKVILAEHEKGALNGCARFIAVLKPSPEQRHAIELAHNRFLAVHALYVNELFAEFVDRRKECERVIRDDPLCREHDREMPTARRDRLRLRAFRQVTGDRHMISPTVYSGESLRKLLKAYAALRVAVEQSASAGFQTFVAEVVAILTDEQQVRLLAASQAYEIGCLVAEERTLGFSADGLVASHIDVRLLCDSSIPVASALPPGVENVRAAMSDTLAALPDARAEIDTLLNEYEAMWLARHAELDAVRSRAGDTLFQIYSELVQPKPMDRITRTIRCEQSRVALVETLRFQARVAELLARHSHGDADKWQQATNRLIYRHMDTVWPPTDARAEIEQAILAIKHDANIGEDSDTLSGLNELLSEYTAERTSLAQRVRQALLVWSQVLCDDSPPDVVFQARQRFQSLLAHAVRRRDWYRAQIALLRLNSNIPPDEEATNVERNDHASLCECVNRNEATRIFRLPVLQANNTS